MNEEKDYLNTNYNAVYCETLPPEQLRMDQAKARKLACFAQIIGAIRQEMRDVFPVEPGEITEVWRYDLRMAYLNEVESGIKEDINTIAAALIQKILEL